MLDLSKLETEIQNLKLEDLRAERDKSWAFFMKLKQIIQFKEELEEIAKRWKKMEKVIYNNISDFFIGVTINPEDRQKNALILDLSKNVNL